MFLLYLNREEISNARRRQQQKITSAKLFCLYVRRYGGLSAVCVASSLLRNACNSWQLHTRPFFAVTMDAHTTPKLSTVFFFLLPLLVLTPHPPFVLLTTLSQGYSDQRNELGPINRAMASFATVEGARQVKRGGYEYSNNIFGTTPVHQQNLIQEPTHHHHNSTRPRGKAKVGHDESLHRHQHELSHPAASRMPSRGEYNAPAPNLPAEVNLFAIMRVVVPLSLAPLLFTVRPSVASHCFSSCILYSTVR